MEAWGWTEKRGKSWGRKEEKTLLQRTKPSLDAPFLNVGVCAFKPQRVSVCVCVCWRSAAQSFVVEDRVDRVLMTATLQCFSWRIPYKKNICQKKEHSTVVCVPLWCVFSVMSCCLVVTFSLKPHKQNCGDDCHKLVPKTLKFYLCSSNVLCQLTNTDCFQWHSSNISTDAVQRELKQLS